MQCQLFCTGRNYCDFVVWTDKDTHIQRIYPDEKFWAGNVIKAKLLFQRSILPELIGKFYSHPMEQTSLLSTNPPDEPIPSTSGTYVPHVQTTQILLEMFITNTVQDVKGLTKKMHIPNVHCYDAFSVSISLLMESYFFSYHTFYCSIRMYRKTIIIIIT